jgi:protein-tyrosine phosphatase
MFLFIDLTNILDNEEDMKILFLWRRGISRSSSVIIGYIMKKANVGFEEAFEWLKASKHIIDPNIGFVLQLKELEKTLDWNTSETC